MYHMLRKLLDVAVIPLFQQTEGKKSCSTMPSNGWHVGNVLT